MEQRMKHPWLCRSMMLLLIFTILAAYMPQATFEAFAATKASVYDGRQLKGSDGKPYYPNNKGGGFYWAKFSNLAGDGFVYRLARATSAKKTIVVKNGKHEYSGYCLEHGAWLNAGATGYSADAQQELERLRWMRPYSKDTLRGMQLALLFGRQPGHTQSDVPVKGCNLDDWYWATQNIIWEYQQGLRKSPTSGLKARTGSHAMSANWFKDTVKGRPAEKIYNWMNEQIKKYQKQFSFTAPTERQIKKRQTIKMQAQSDGTWVAVVKDSNKLNQDIKTTNKNIKIKRNGNEYTITSNVDPNTIKKPIKATKDVKGISKPKQDLLVWTTTQDSPISDSNHLQTVATGGDDPIELYFKLAAAEETEPEPGEPEEPKLPSFELDVEKLDANLGFDNNTHTGMGDAPLDATIDLLVDGEVVDSKTLDVNGYSDEPFYFMPWDDASELDYEKVEKKDPETEKVTVHHYWRGERTVSTEESGVPDGRLSDEKGGTRDHGTITYYAHAVDDGPIEYNITYENGALTDAADIDPENPQPMLDDMGSQAYVNDNYRGRLQIVKTKTDLDPFTPENGSGKLEYSTNSKWTIELTSGGFEDHPYIRVVPVKEGEKGYDEFANCYRVVRDNSGTPADVEHPLTVSKFGQIRIIDLPYGNYLVKEISADSNGYVLESHEVTVTEDGQLISTDTDNIPKKNKVQIIKTNSETGKAVRLNENAAFRIKYLGNPDLADPTLSPNYGKYLPNGSSYTDGAASGKNNYIFKCNADGQIVLPYELEYGNYQIEEVTAPEGYFIGEYDEKGVGSSTDMPKKFEDAVVIYDASGDRVTDFTSNKKVIFNKYKFSVTEQTPHQDGKDYVTYYLTVKIPNNPVKGKIQITKNGESLAGWLHEEFGGNKGFSAVWDRSKLKNATFRVYAAEDILQVDDVQRIKAYDSKTNEEVALEEVTRDHSKKNGALSLWEKLLKTGEKILRWFGLDIGDDNECRTEYIAKSEKGATYSAKYAVKDKEGITSTYTVDYSLSYTKGGMNYTNIHVKKDMVADDYVACIDYTTPTLKSGGEDVDILDLILPNKNMVKLNKAVVDEYGEDDITAKILEPMALVVPLNEDKDPEVKDGWTLVKKADKYLATFEEPQVDDDGNPILDEETKEPVTKTIYKVYVNDNGKKKWVESDEDGVFEDANTPKKIPEGFTKTDKADMYQITKNDAESGKAVYMVWAVDGGVGRWLSCDADGNFYKSYHQEWDFTLSQHFDCADGFVFSFDGLIVDAAADNAAQIAKTVVTNPWKVTPEITHSDAYQYETTDNITTFTAAPTDAAPVYFKVNNGIKTSMIYQGGQTITTINVKQSQLYNFGVDSKPEDTTSVEKLYPTIEYTTDEETELIEWCKDLTPDNTKFDRVFDESNYVKVIRHEVSPESKDEVSYEIVIVTDNKDENLGFKVTYPDTTTLQPINCTDDGEEAGKLVFKSIEGTMVYPLGSPVATITTDENGIATTPNLPLGKYYVQEVKSGNGHVNSSEWREFELKYADQYTPLIWDEATLDNSAVSVKVDLSKLFETSYKSKEYQPGAGAVFGIFSAEEITAKTKTEKKIDTKKIGSDSLVGTITTREDGSGTAIVKLPLGKYYIKELSAPEGYKLNGTKYYFDAVDILTADQIDFAYDDIGVSGYVTQDGNDQTIVNIESLYSKPMNNLKVDGTEYDLLQSVTTENVVVEKLDGRTRTKVTVPTGKSSTVTFANGSTLNIAATKTTYTATFDGGAAPELELGNETTLTKAVEGTKTIVTYSPKVTKTNWLSEVAYEYEPPKNTDKGEGGFTVVQPANKKLALTSAVGTSEITASIDYAYAAAELTFTRGTVTGITVDDKAIDSADYADGITLKRIVKTPVMVENPDDPEGEKIQKVDKDGNLVFETTVNATKAVINFADGVTYTVQFDAAGNFYMDASGYVDDNLETESILSVDGNPVTADSLKIMKLINIKNTTAKTYARNNTDAGVLNITVNNIKNDRIPTDVPEIPDNPGTPDIPSIRTIAKDSETHEHISKADDKVTIIDTVSYTALTPGQEYTLKGVLMDKETGKELLANGKPVTAEKVFTPEKSSGTVDMEFTFDGSKLENMATVVFEELYKNIDTDKDGKPDTPEDKLAAAHKDITDEGQTIYFPKIKTNATDSETEDHISNADKKVTIKDEVTYYNLIPGKEYTVSGVLMDKETGKALLVDGKKITAEKTFVADSANGSVTLEFTLDASALAGKATVVFESLKYDGKEVAVHKDIKDKNQTVIFKKKIGTVELTPPKGPNPYDDTSITVDTITPQTGDTTNLFVWVALALMALLTMFEVYRKVKTKERKE
jgi:hypothetical protein